MPRPTHSKKKKSADLVESASQRPSVPVDEQQELKKQAARLRRLETLYEEPIAVLPEDASSHQFDAERVHRAVRVGTTIHMPFWKDGTVGIPNCMLRSPLWSAKTIPLANAQLNEDAPLPVLFDTNYDDIRIEARGALMGAYDRRVFAACLNLFRDQPIFLDGKPTELAVTFYRLVGRLGAGYSPETQQSVAASLSRLSKTSVTVWAKGVEYQVPFLLGATWPSDAPITGSVTVTLSLAPSIANLFSRAAWTAVPQEALDAGKGLKSWLSCFYATHSRPYPVSLKRLYSLSGYTGLIGDFRVKLWKALSALGEGADTSVINVRKFVEKEGTFEVHLSRWQAM